MKPKIVIVEDEFIIAEDLKLTIQDFGYDVIKTLPSAQKTIEFLKTAQPDLIVMDIKIEGSMNGVDLARYIKKTYDIPVIFCTAYYGREIAKVNEELNTKVVRKPFLDFVLKETIESAIQEKN